MSDVNTDDLAKQLGQLNPMQLVALTKKLEADWGVTATPQVSNTVQLPGTDTDKPAEQTEFTVVLASFPADKKMTLLKLVRELTGLGLKEAKDFVESVPKTVKDGLSKADAEALKTQLTAAGGVVEVK
jgi:large subunit ribosomal protein L7/L12